MDSTDEGPLTDAGLTPPKAASLARQPDQQFVGSIRRPDEYQLLGDGRRGGEGITWCARFQGGLPQPVNFAVKQLLAPRGRTPDDWPEPAQLDRWNQQLKLLYLVRHDHLVSYKEFFDGWPPHPAGSCLNEPPASLRTWYLAMDWVDGANLLEVVEDGRVGLTERMRYIVEIADALEYLHSGAQTQGMALLHRDVTPSNVIVNPERGPVLVDFGLLRVEEPTVTELPAWTGAYLAPEVHGDKTRSSRASDLWALAGTTFFAITGEHPSPFDAELMRRQLAAALGGRVADPRSMIDIVMLVLGKPPDERPASPVAWAARLPAASAPQTPTPSSTGTGSAERVDCCPYCRGPVDSETRHCRRCAAAPPPFENESVPSVGAAKRRRVRSSSGDTRREFRRVSPPLPIVRWNSQAGDFTFGVPMYWRDASHEELQFMSSFGDARMDVALIPDRDDSYTTNIMVTRARFPQGNLHSFMGRPNDLLSSRAVALNHQPWSDPYYVAIGAEPAVLFHLRGMTPGRNYADSVPNPELPVFTMITESWTYHNRQIYGIFMVGPEENHAMYLHAYYTVIGSWQWRV